jgi:hypothetical protein
MIQLKLIDDEQVVLFIDPRDDAGLPSKIDGDPIWSISDASALVLLDVDPPDPKKRLARTTGTALGSTRVNVSVDVALDDAVENLEDFYDIEVAGGKTTSLGVAAGTPEKRPA